MSIFVWTEAFNCGEILPPMISSYLQHHDLPIHVYGTKNDLSYLNVESKLLRKELLSENEKYKKIEKKVLKGYKNGHLGTAILWKFLISTRPEDIFIHIDSDTVFVNNGIKEIIEALKQKDFSIAGSRRPYRHRHYRLNGKDHETLNNMPDAVNTDCFGFKTDLIKKRPKFLLKRKILGKRTSFVPNIDFFDPITFEIIGQGGKICYLDSPDEGAHSKPNKQSSFFQSRISFAAVGSGSNFFKNPNVNTSVGYRNFALKSYSLYAKKLLNIDTGLELLNDQEIEEKLSRLDKANWTLR